jgi:hypothetical protein
MLGGGLAGAIVNRYRPVRSQAGLAKRRNCSTAIQSCAAWPNSMSWLWGMLRNCISSRSEEARPKLREAIDRIWERE